MTTVLWMSVKSISSGRYSAEVQNHDGYYDASGKYVAFAEER